jgi:tRNA A37 methylthiotransferase MiaB
LNRSFVGKEIDVLIESVDGNCAADRSYRDAPGIDGSVTVEGYDGPVGNIIRARVTGASDYDLTAQYCEN